MNRQDFLRKQTKYAKACNKGQWTYKMFAEVIGVTQNAFYNWLNGYYELSDKKVSELETLLCDLID